MESGAYSVKLNLYDLSQGMAKQFSQGMLGKLIEGIWHTGIVVYGREYFFGGGICDDTPGKTPYGIPIKTIDLGSTELPKDMFLDFLREINPKFAPEKYDLFKNNCNNFTDECAQFLVGEKIPTYITGLPEEVLKTPLGKMLQPSITQMQQRFAAQSHPTFESQNTQDNVFNGNNDSQQSTGPAIVTISRLDEFLGVIEEYPAAIAGMFGVTCPPCKAILPVFERMAQEYATKYPKIKFIKVITDFAPDISRNFNIRGVPTFIGFFDGLKIDAFSGANETKIRQLLSNLVGRLEWGQNGKSGPKGESFDFDLFNPDGDSPFFFVSDNYALPISKIQELVEKDKLLSESSMKDAFNIFSQSPKELVKQFNKDQKGYLVTWLSETLLYIGIGDKVIPFIDLLRMLCADPSYTEILAGNGSDFLNSIAQTIAKDEKYVAELPKGLRLILLRFLSNVAGAPSGAKWLETNYESITKKVFNNIKFFQTEPAALTAVLMLMMNFIQNVGSGSKVLEKEANELLNHLAQLLGKETDENSLLAIVINTCWLGYRVKDVRPLIKKLPEIAKVEKLRTSAINGNLAKAAKDLQTLTT
jgi:thiol-disulfide isomerase/thioredoxin